MITSQNNRPRLFFQGSEYVARFDDLPNRCMPFEVSGYTPYICEVCWRKVDEGQEPENEEIVSNTTPIEVTPVVNKEGNETETPDVTQEKRINQANELLRFLYDRAIRFHADNSGATWQELLGTLLTEKETAAGIKAAEKANKNGTGIIRTIPGGTAIANESSLSSEDAQLSIALLKANNRIVQCGRGRGKALILTGTQYLPFDTPIPEDLVPKTTAVSSESSEEIEVIPANDVPNLLRAARDEYRNLRRAKEEAERGLRTANNRISELEAQLAGKDAEIESYQRRINQQALTTWQ